MKGFRLGWLVLAMLAPGSMAASLTGTVVGVTDGDTLTVLRELESIKVRLAEVDAPERGQPFGARARQSLSDLCFRRVAVVSVRGVDRYGRTIGAVSCDGIDAGAEQVRRGFAWVYTRYATDPALPPLQDEARGAKRGLWADDGPVAPWAWRAR